MAKIEIFDDEAFSVISLTAAIQETEHVPGRIAELGLFDEKGITSTIAKIEYDGTRLMLVPAKPRGGVGTPTVLKGRRSITVETVHLPLTATMMADEIQGIRAFGSMSELEVAQRRLNQYLTTHRQSLDLTHEWQRVGAINGLILDADGTSVLEDVYDRFGIEKTKFHMQLDKATTFARTQSENVLDLISDALNGMPVRKARALCGKKYWEDLINHKSVRETYLNTTQAAELRGHTADEFELGGVIYERYRGSLNKVPFIPDEEARAFPVGIPDFFITRFAPADYMEVANSEGVPFYSKLETMRFNKGIEIESQSNPLHMPTLPQGIIHLQAGSK
ncbi:major capsid protein [Paenalcaligenes suwonensis]|uniref:major capsid protein n=1 Tax=Paenalcaligenes suwonensis TaxID=1202713 RepID=UPI00140A43DD|nr:major capsid protein [Paenalcaligenes suwonensis]NHC62184.1 major capsid protein [Paenalcaligenes suwonensis]